MIRVLIADDEHLIRAGIRTVLESVPDIEVVAEADNGEAAVHAATTRRPDVALIDLRMPVLDGMGAIDELRRQMPELRVVVLTSFGAEPNVLRAVQSSVSGFVLKSCAPDELILAVRSAHNGAAYLSPAVARMVLGMVGSSDMPQRQTAMRRLSTLSPRETEVLDLVAEGLSNASIAQRLRMTEASVKTHVSRILAKLGCENRVQAALLVRDAGRRPRGRPER
jgi:DNA-binding NarL/FixJ family response regulator